MPEAARALAPAPQREQLKIVIVGHVDHGKSSLIGRLFHDTDSLPDGKFAAIEASAKKRGMPFEWSFLLDALQAERDQGITIDTTQMWFKTAARDYVIIDAPGHKEFLKNMISGAASADAAILLIDAQEGVKEQSRRHGYLLHLLGIRQVAVAVNKMDLMDYSAQRFAALQQEYSDYLHSIGVTATAFIPISAREGWNIAPKPGANALPAQGWYKGPAIIDMLDAFTPSAALSDLPLRFPVQDVYKFDSRRILAGRIESGRLKTGDTLLFSPSNKQSKIRSIESWPPGTRTTTQAGESIGITLEDPLFIERGEMASHLQNAPLLSHAFHARVVWLGDRPLRVGNRYKIKLQTAEFAAELRSIEKALDTDDLALSDATEIPRHGIGEVTFRLRGLAALDDHAALPRTGRFVIIEDYDVVGGGIVDLTQVEDRRLAPQAAQNIFAPDDSITPAQRARSNGHSGAVLWFTGLSGSGKSTLTQALKQRLFARGLQVFVLDGDALRTGLCADLTFSPEDREENIRRAGEVAALFAKAGMIVLTAFISPTREGRHRAELAAPDCFHTIHVKADLATCEARDVKGLYKKARQGEIADFTGISAPYEEPLEPDMEIDTTRLSVEEAVERLVAYVEAQCVVPLTLPAQPHQYKGEGI